jgi:hypothetical protein
MQVETSVGMKSMKDLRIGDEVLAPVQGNQFAWQPITWFLHLDHQLEAEFLELKTAHQTLSLTPHHLVPVVACDFDLSALGDEGVSTLMSAYAVYAQRATVGQCLIRVDAATQQIHLEPIVAIANVRKQGVYSPMTASGSLVVEQIHASCYSNSIESYTVQHSFYSAYHRASGWFTSAWAAVTHEDKVEVPLGLWFLGSSQAQSV